MVYIVLYMLHVLHRLCVLFLIYTHIPLLFFDNFVISTLETNV